MTGNSRGKEKPQSSYKGNGLFSRRNTRGRQKAVETLGARKQEHKVATRAPKKRGLTEEHEQPP